MSGGPSGRRFDIALAIRRAGIAFWDDFAAIVIGGFAAVTLPQLLAATLDPAAGSGTLATTARAVFAMLYLAMVSHGVSQRLHGQPLPTRRFIAEGLARARPGLEVALLLGAGGVLLLTVELFGRSGTLAGTALHALVAGGAIWAACVLLPVVPAAVAERLRPLAAIRRAAALTLGHRDRLLALLVIVMLTLAPAAVFIAVLVDGDTRRLDGPGLWLSALFTLLACSVLATVPPVVYAGLAGDAEPIARPARGDFDGRHGGS